MLSTRSQKERKKRNVDTIAAISDTKLSAAVDHTYRTAGLLAPKIVIVKEERKGIII